MNYKFLNKNVIIKAPLINPKPGLIKTGVEIKTCCFWRVECIIIMILQNLVMILQKLVNNPSTPSQYYPSPNMFCEH
jgi:hypothetical protein